MVEVGTRHIVTRPYNRDGWSVVKCLNGHGVSVIFSVIFCQVNNRCKYARPVTMVTTDRSSHQKNWNNSFLYVVVVVVVNEAATRKTEITVSFMLLLLLLFFDCLYILWSKNVRVKNLKSKYSAFVWIKENSYRGAIVSTKKCPHRSDLRGRESSEYWLCWWRWTRGVLGRGLGDPGGENGLQY